MGQTITLIHNLSRENNCYFISHNIVAKTADVTQTKMLGFSPREGAIMHSTARLLASPTNINH